MDSRLVGVGGSLACFPAILSGGALAIKEQVADLFLDAMEGTRSKGDSRSNSRAGRSKRSTHSSDRTLCRGYGSSDSYGSKGKQCDYGGS